MQQLGRYQIFCEIGRGGAGIVYQGFDPGTRRPVAVKAVRLPDLCPPGEIPALRERFQRSLQAAAGLCHPGIVALYEVREDGDVLQIVMEFVKGTTLERLLASGRRPNRAAILKILRQAATALDYAHQHGIVHREVKPANIMIRDDGAVKIAGFGIPGTDRLPAPGPGGHVPYVTPEHALARPVQPRTDQFCLGLIATELLAEQPPFSGPDMIGDLAAILSDEPPPELLNVALGPPVEAVFRKVLAKDPAGRYPTCSQFVSALGAALEHAPLARPVVTPAAAPPPPPPPVAHPVQPSPLVPARLPRQRKSSAWVTALIIALAVFLATALAGAYIWNKVTASVPEPDTSWLMVTPPPPPPPAAAEPVRTVQAERPPSADDSTPAAQQVTAAGALKQATLIHRVDPVYPPLARQARIEGVVRLKVSINRDGTVQNIQVVSGHPLLVPAAVDAVKQWQYSPTLINSEPVEIVTQVDVNFTLTL